MKTYFECIPCFMQQALKAGRMTAKDDKQLKKILDETGCLIKSFSLENTPAEYGAEVYRVIREITGVEDPYKEIKKQSIEDAKKLYPELKQIIEQSENRLLTAVRIAIAGNIIDFGVNKKFSLEEDVQRILTQDFAIFDFPQFEKAVQDLYRRQRRSRSDFGAGIGNPGEREMKTQSNLSTTRLLLRPFILGDALQVQKLAGDRDIAAMTATIPHPYEDMVQYGILKEDIQ